MDQIAVGKKIRELSKSKGRYSPKKLKKVKSAYRIRIGNLRIVYKKSKTSIRVVFIGHRKDIYKLVDRLLK